MLTGDIHLDPSSVYRATAMFDDPAVPFVHGEACEIDVYVSCAEEVVRNGGMVPVLDDEERRRACAMKDAGSYLGFVASRIMLREALSRSVDHAVRPEQWRFSRDALGKPSVAGCLPRIFFNISHADRFVAVAISRSCEVGVDLETLAGARDGVLEEVLSGNERRALAGLPADAAERRFLALWTAKEASAKALGVGCAMDLARIDVDLDGRRAHLEDGIGSVHATLGLNVARIRSRDAELCLAVATV